jgi:negative regulator of flagellin synthesis FlgM
MVSEVTGPGGGIIYLPEAGQGAQGVGAGNRPERKNQVEAAKDSDQVVLTDKAVTLHAIAQAVAKVSPVDDQRVAAIKGALEDGSYQMEPEKIAEKLMQMEAMMPKKQDPK